MCIIDRYLTFARIGVCTFGGGYAMLPILQRDVVENRHWATEDELMDYYAIGQCTPCRLDTSDGISHVISHFSITPLL